MPFQFTGYFGADTGLTPSELNNIAAGSWTVPAGGPSSLTVSDGSDPTVLAGDGGSDSPIDPTQLVTAGTTNTGNFINYEGVVQFNGSDGNTYTAIVFDYDEDGSGGISNNNSAGTNSNGVYEEGFFIAFVPDGFDVNNLTLYSVGGTGTLPASALPPPGTTLTKIPGELVNNAGLTNIVLCFGSGTLIETPAGPVAVEDLKAGDLVSTLEHGAQPLRWRGKARLTGRHLALKPHLRPIRILKGALGPNSPSNDLTLSPQHRVVVSSRIAQRVAGSPDVLVAANKLTSLPGVFVDESDTGVEYHHLLFDRHELVHAAGAITESLFLGPEARKALSPAAWVEISALFPELTGASPVQAPARPMPCGKIQKKIISRHLKNGKPVQPSCTV